MLLPPSNKAILVVISSHIFPFVGSIHSEHMHQYGTNQCSLTRRFQPLNTA